MNLVSDFPVMLKDFLDQLNKHRTRRAYQSDIREYLGEDELTEDTIPIIFAPDRIQSYFRELSESSKGSSVIQRRRSALRSFLKWIRKVHALNVTSALSTLSDLSVGTVASGTSRRNLQPTEVEELLSVLSGNGRRVVRDKAVIMVIYHGCLRRSEIARMDVEHIREAGKTVYIDIPRDNDMPAVLTTVPAMVYDALQKHIQTNEIWSGCLWRSFSNNSRGLRLSQRSIHGIVKRAGKRAGLPNVSADDLRFAGFVNAISHMVDNCPDLEPPAAIDGYRLISTLG